MKKLSDYFNGNVHVQLFSDGTRILETDDNYFDFQYPLNIDMTITNKCSVACDYCYLNCRPGGKFADLLSVKFFDTLLKGTELAINLNDCDHPQLYRFLERMQDRGIFVNGTVSQEQFMKNKELLREYCDAKLLWGWSQSLRLIASSVPLRRVSKNLTLRRSANLPPGLQFK